MKRIDIEKGQIHYSFNIENYKIIIGKNIYNLYEIKNIIQEYFNSNKVSEYSNENLGISTFKIDNKLLKTKDINYFYVTEDYSLLEDMKLTSKSLLNKYYECLFNQEEYSETLMTLNALFEAFSVELDSSIIKTVFSNLSNKLLIKLITPIFLKDDLESSNYDLNYDEIILFQLEIIDYISMNELLKTNIVVLSISYLTVDILNKVKQMNNILVIIITNNTKEILDINNIYLIDYLFDLSDEQKLYEYYSMNNCDTLEEAKKTMKNTLNKALKILDQSLLNK